MIGFRQMFDWLLSDIRGRPMPGRHVVEPNPAFHRPSVCLGWKLYAVFPAEGRAEAGAMPEFAQREALLGELGCPTVFLHERTWVAKCAEMCRAAIDRLGPESQDEPSPLRAERAAYTLNLAFCLSDLGRVDEAIVAARDSARRWRELTASEGLFRRWFAIAAERHALRCRERSGDLAGAMRHAQELDEEHAEFARELAASGMESAALQLEGLRWRLHLVHCNWAAYTAEVEPAQLMCISAALVRQATNCSEIEVIPMELEEVFKLGTSLRGAHRDFDQLIVARQEDSGPELANFSAETIRHLAFVAGRVNADCPELALLIYLSAHRFARLALRGRRSRVDAIEALRNAAHLSQCFAFRGEHERVIEVVDETISLLDGWEMAPEIQLRIAGLICNRAYALCLKGEVAQARVEAQRALGLLKAAACDPCDQATSLEFQANCSGLIDHCAHLLSTGFGEVASRVRSTEPIEVGPPPAPHPTILKHLAEANDTAAIEGLMAGKPESTLSLVGGVEEADPRRMALRAEALRLLGRPEESLPIAEALLRSHPSLLHRKLVGLSRFESALASDPRFATAPAKRSEERIEQLRAAARDFEEALLEKFDDQEALELRAMALCRMVVSEAERLSVLWQWANNPETDLPVAGRDEWFARNHGAWELRVHGALDALRRASKSSPGLRGDAGEIVSWLKTFGHTEESEVVALALSLSGTATAAGDGPRPLAPAAPQNRHQFAREFRRDNDLYLEGKPIGAGPDTIGYRARKFLRRNKTALCAVALVAVTLAVGLGYRPVAEAYQEWSETKRMNAFEVLAQEPDPAVVTDAAARERIKETGKPWKIRHTVSGIVMLLVPPGEFMMGSEGTAESREDDEVQHKRVIRNSFYLSQNEVSKGEWYAMTGNERGFSEGDALPVERVSWKNIHKDFLAPARGFFRLPSEAEWEYACRAGTTTAYSFGETITMEQVCFGSKNPVACGSLPANPWGFHEMHGNVWEWVEDAYADYPKEVGGQEAVEGNASSNRVLRGGAWGNDSGYVRSSIRNNRAPVGTSGYIGFRVARAPL